MSLAGLKRLGQTDLVELVDVITALEDGLAAEQLGQNTANTPHVDARCLRATSAIGHHVAAPAAEGENNARSLRS